MTTRNDPIGVFDSGLGGFTVVREIMRLLPHEDIVYLGDSARLPYGTKSKRQIIQFSLANARFLERKNVKALVVACNTSSANAFAALTKRFPLPLIDVIQPVAREACRRTHINSVGVIGTGATIASGAYQKELKALNPRLKVYAVKCPLFVPLVEEGWRYDDITRLVIKRYLVPLKQKGIDTLILGCTHYPLLKKLIADEMGPHVTIVDSGPHAALVLKQELNRRELLSHRVRRGALKTFVTDLSPRFVHIGTQFLRRPLGTVRVVEV